MVAAKGHKYKVKRTALGLFAVSTIIWVCSFIGTDWSGPVLKAFVYLVSMGSDRSIVGPGRNRLLRIGPFLSSLLQNYPTVGPQCGTGTARTVCLLRTGPYQIKMARTNK
jgi:hypothetical protein